MRSAWRDDVDAADRVDAYMVAEALWHGSPVNRSRPRPSVTLSLAELLQVESRFTRHTSSKEEAILALGIRPARYYQLLRIAIATPEALEADPVLVNRIRKGFEERRAARASRTFRKGTR